jgi:hypothetical protein
MVGLRAGPDFVPVLLRQRDHARNRNQTDRAALFDQLIHQADENTPLDTDHPYNTDCVRAGYGSAGQFAAVGNDSRRHVLAGEGYGFLLGPMPRTYC